MMNCCCCESQQEAWIREAAEGKPNRFRKDNPRVIDMLESFDCTPPYVDIERARYFTESMKQTEGELLVLRWAKALKHIGENMTVYIDDDQLIAGRCGQQGARYGILYPELDGDYQASALKELPGHEASPFDVNAEDARAVEEIISELHRDHLREVPSSEIGKKVIEKLYAIDPVAYIRYVSVYRQFSNVEEFIQEITQMRHQTLIDPLQRKLPIL